MGDLKTNKTTTVKVDIEYCNVCNFKRQCDDLAQYLMRDRPDVDVQCVPGRRGSFEVTINDVLIHSKLQSLAFPDHKDVAENVQNAIDGKVLYQVKQQPITDCIIS